MITIALGDGDIIFRKKLAEHINGLVGMMVVHQAADGDRFLQPFRMDTLPNVAMLDSCLPEENPFNIAQSFRFCGFKTVILVLSNTPSRAEAEKALQAGVVSYVDKAAGMDVIVAAIRACHRHKTFVYFKKGFWLQKIIGNRIGKNLLDIFPRRKGKDTYSELLKKGVSKQTIDSALYKYFSGHAQKKNGRRD